MTQWLLAAAAVLTALAPLVMWWVKRRDAQHDRIPKAAAEVALAQQALGIVKESRDYLADDVRRLMLDRDEDRSRIDKLEADRATDRARIGRLEALLGVAAGYIEALLLWVLTGAKPPHPPLPDDLNDLIDPSLLGTD